MAKYNIQEEPFKPGTGAKEIPVALESEREALASFHSAHGGGATLHAGGQTLAPRIVKISL
jgi:hypothetical protein